VRILILFCVLTALSGLFSDGSKTGLCHSRFQWWTELSEKNGRETGRDCGGSLERGGALQTRVVLLAVRKSRGHGIGGSMWFRACFDCKRRIQGVVIGV